MGVEEVNLTGIQLYVWDAPVTFTSSLYSGSFCFSCVFRFQPPHPAFFFFFFLLCIVIILHRLPSDVIRLRSFFFLCGCWRFSFFFFFWGLKKRSSFPLYIRRELSTGKHTRCCFLLFSCSCVWRHIKIPDSSRQGEKKWEREQLTAKKRETRQLKQLWAELFNST